MLLQAGEEWYFLPLPDPAIQTMLPWGAAGAGASVGAAVGAAVGFGVGSGVGSDVGSGVGSVVGSGLGVGVAVGSGVGVGDGSGVGVGVEIGVGDGVGSEITAATEDEPGSEEDAAGTELSEKRPASTTKHQIAIPAPRNIFSAFPIRSLDGRLAEEPVFDIGRP